MVKFYCAIAGVTGSSFPVDFDENESVGDLKNAIWETIKEKFVHDEEFKRVVALDLQLFHTKKADDAWLDEDEVAGATLEGSSLMKSSLLLKNDEYFGASFQRAEGKVHVLIRVPPPVNVGVETMPKRRKMSAKSASLADLWRYSDMHLTALPNSLELKNILARKLPFRLVDVDDQLSDAICDQTGERIQCQQLATKLQYFLLDIPLAIGVEDGWEHLYDILFNIVTSLCCAKGVPLAVCRNRVDNPKTIEARLRPNRVLHYHGTVLLRGEEKSASTSIQIAFKKLITKMRKWSPIFYGDLPYIVGYVTSGNQLKIVLIDRRLHTETLVDLYSITAQKEEAIKAFYNLSFFLVNMIALSKRTCDMALLPFTPHVNEKRRIELMNGCVVRRIRYDQCRDDDDFARIGDIYENLKGLSFQEQENTHLQTVRLLKLKNSTRTVQLEPVGFHRKPENEMEVQKWLREMLTGLKHWHGRNYCHGDLRWRNIVYVPNSTQGYWIIIDMDESRRPNATKITWDHQRPNELLNFCHDLFQLGRLMKTFQFSLSGNVKRIMLMLLESRGSNNTAENMLTELNARDHDIEQTF